MPRVRAGVKRPLLESARRRILIQRFTMAPDIEDVQQTLVSSLRPRAHALTPLSRPLAALRQPAPRRGRPRRQRVDCPGAFLVPVPLSRSLARHSLPPALASASPSSLTSACLLAGLRSSWRAPASGPSPARCPPLALSRSRALGVRAYLPHSRRVVDVRARGMSHAP